MQHLQVLGRGARRDPEPAGDLGRWPAVPPADRAAITPTHHHHPDLPAGLRSRARRTAQRGLTAARELSARRRNQGQPSRPSYQPSHLAPLHRIATSASPGNRITVGANAGSAPTPRPRTKTDAPGVTTAADPGVVRVGQRCIDLQAWPLSHGSLLYLVPGTPRGEELLCTGGL